MAPPQQPLQQPQMPANEHAQHLQDLLNLQQQHGALAQQAANIGVSIQTLRAALGLGPTDYM